MKTVSSARSMASPDIKGISEAIGTVLLLGISITLAGGIALWTSQIEDGDDAIIVDLGVFVRGDDLVIIHRGGDILDSTTTDVIILDMTGTEIMTGNFYDLSPTNDEDWSIGEEITVDVSGWPDVFDVIITAVRNNGVREVVLKSTLYRDSLTSGYPDIAVTRVVVLNSDSVPQTRINDDGTYIFSVEVSNFGNDMTIDHFSDNGDNTIRNLRIFDDKDDLSFDTMNANHFTSGGAVTLYPGDPGFGRLLSGDTMTVDMTWTRSSREPRTLGRHTLSVKVIPYPEGEQDYGNNYVKRSFNVDKLLKPLPFFGPDPGIYDIKFSDNAPNSGQNITVTVIVQNSGDQPILPEYGVHLVVSHWKPEVHTAVSTASYDWRVDYPGHEGEWRSDFHDHEVTYDDEFPTCTVPNISMLPGSYFFFYFQMEARVDVPGGLQWVYAAIDVYDNPDHLEGVPITNGDSTNDNFGLASIQVLPRILLVDDDEAPMKTDLDMTSSVLEALVGSGITVDTITQTDRVNDDGVIRDSPAFSYVQGEIAAPALKDYDVVIWVTGYIEDPLTNNVSTPGGGNIQEMMKYLDSNGYLMIIGTIPFGGLYSYFGTGFTNEIPPMPVADRPYAEDASKFLYRYMGILKVDTKLTLPSGEDAELIGIDNGEDGLTPGHHYSIKLREALSSDPDMELLTLRDDTDPVPSEFLSPVGVLTTPEGNLSDPKRCVMGRSFSDPESDISGAQYRSVFASMDISRFNYLNEKVEIIASAMKWFDWEIEVGRDLAITRMKMYILTEVIEDEEAVWKPIPLTEDNPPKYLDTILIEASVRNNGRTVDGSSVMFYVKGPDGVELPITPGIPDPRTGEREIYDNPKSVPSIPGGGGEVSLYKLWLAVGVGSFEFRVVVDPYQLVTEISETNNDITYSTSTITSFVTRNNVLVVDDDSSDDNFASDGDTQGAKGTRVITYPDGEPSDIIAGSLDAMEIDHEIFEVKNTFAAGDGWSYDSGLSIIDLKRYNSIIWVTGDTGDRAGPTRRETFTDTDLRAIMSYLDGNYPEARYLGSRHNENLMFIGSGILFELSTYRDDMVTASVSVGDFMERYMGLSSSVPYQGTSRLIYGPIAGDYLERPFVGTRYLAGDFDRSFDFSEVSLAADLDSKVQTGMIALNTNDGSQRAVSSHFSTHDDVSDNYFRTMLHSWQLTDASHDQLETSLNEIMYLGLHWFETPSHKPEMVGRDTKIFFENDHPVIGNSYLVQAEVINIGGIPGGGTVRFMDGGTLIKSISIYLDPDQSTVIEAIWTPLYAGNREFSVIIDHYDDYDEVFDNYNNHPSQRRTIYFFWDNMESGTGNWEHDANLMRLNGESSVDFMDPLITDVDTNVISDWDLSMSMGLNRTGNDSYSAPYSFHLKESQGITRNEADVLISMVIDDSASMSERYASDGVTTWLDAAKDAAKVLLDQLSDDSVFISIWDFNGNMERRWSGPDDDIDYLSNRVSKNLLRLPVRLGDDHDGKDGREKIRDEIDSMNNPPGQTILWDAIGGAYQDIDFYSEYYPQLNPVVVVLSDGTDAQASDRSSLGVQKIEGGSSSWAPWDDMADGEQRYDQGHFGKYTLDWSDPAGSTMWIEALTHGGSVDRTRTGLLYSNIPIYTIGLGLESHDPPNEPEITYKPAEYTIDLVNAYTSASGTKESGTLEYNLWRIADTSDAQYFNAPSADELEEVFEAVGQAIADPGSQTRSGSVPTRDDDDPEEQNFDKMATTKTVSILGSSRAILSFWHKYDMVSGTNGAYLEVGYRDPDVDSNGNGVGNDDWDWKYIIPSSGHYDGNLYLGDVREDSFGNEIVWGWSGTSGNGRFTWQHVSVDLLDHVPDAYRGFVKVRFSYKQYGGGTGRGWWIDDVSISVSRIPSVPIGLYNPDMWNLITGSTSAGTTHSGIHAWFAGDTANKDGDLLDGVDNSLYTRKIDLTNAASATLSAYFKFNLDQQPGKPPDSLRVEVSDDGGISWTSLNMGARAAWSVSGSQADIGDGFEDGKSYTGLDEGNGWVNSKSLTRLMTDLDGFLGKVITIRFRILTDTDTDHFDSDSDPKGVYIDDVMVFGQSLESTRGTHDTVSVNGESTFEDIFSHDPVTEERTTASSGPIFPIVIIMLFSVSIIISIRYLVRATMKGRSRRWFHE